MPNPTPGREFAVEVEIPEGAIMASAPPPNWTPLPDMIAGAAGDDADEVYEALFPSSPARVVAAASAGDEALYRQVYPDPAAAAEDEQHHEVPAGHGPMVAQHAHEHHDYAGGSHYHVHTHAGDASHQPGINHVHQLAAAAPADMMTLHEVYRAMGYD